MLRLALLRHGKSAWADAPTIDHERPLAQRGRRSVPRVAEALVAAGWRPEVALVSDAARALESFELARGAWGEVAALVVPELYLAEVVEIARALARVEDAVRAVAVIGHEPGLSRTVYALTGSPTVLRTSDAALLAAEVPAAMGFAEALARPRSFRLEGRISARALGRRPQPRVASPADAGIEGP